jgi:putative transposase
VDDDKMPKRYNPNAKQKRTFSGQRVKRGLYNSGDGTVINADANGAYNILRKTDSDFSFSKLVEKVSTKINEWLHPTKRIRFWLKKKKETKPKSNPKLRRGDKGLILPNPQC